METKRSTFKFVEEDWFTERTYNNNFKPTPNKSGVYLLVFTPLKLPGEKLEHEILYVGSSYNLKQRSTSHEVVRILSKFSEFKFNVRFYFKETDNYLEEEKKLIGIINPQFNTQWRTT
jgi:excinuclease UvrABC nuclease subunit